MTIPARYTLTEAHFRIVELENALREIEERPPGELDTEDMRAIARKVLSECEHEWVQEHGTSSRYCVLCGAGPDTPACDHEWVDARNSAVESGELCIKCNALRAGNS